jgi:hypothetical protein
MQRRQAREEPAVKTLIFFDGNSALFTNFYTGLTAKTFFFIDGDRLPILKLKDFHGTDIYTFAVAITLVHIYRYRVTHILPPKILNFPPERIG